MVVAIVGLGATIMLMVVLRFTTKMESIEFLTDSELTKLMGIIDLDEIYKVDGIIEGFKDIPLEIGSDNNNILMHVVKPEDRSKLVTKCVPLNSIISINIDIYYSLIRFGIGH